MLYAVHLFMYARSRVLYPYPLVNVRIFFKQNYPLVICVLCLPCILVERKRCNMTYMYILKLDVPQAGFTAYITAVCHTSFCNCFFFPLGRTTV